LEFEAKASRGGIGLTLPPRGGGYPAGGGGGVQVAMEEEEVAVAGIQVVVVVGIQVIMLVEGVQVAMVVDIQVVVEYITMLVVVECLLETEVVKRRAEEEEDLERLVEEEEEEEEDSENLVEEEEVKRAMAVAMEDFLRPMEVLLLETEVRLSLAAAAAVSQVMWVVVADHVHQSHHSAMVANLTTLLLEALALLAPDMARRSAREMHKSQMFLFRLVFRMDLHSYKDTSLFFSFDIDGTIYVVS
jgi:hypothetical protein